MKKTKKTTTAKKKKTSLVIVESPAKIKTISKILGNDYLVKSSYGHIRDLPKSKFGIDIDNDFKPTYIIIRKQRKTVNELKKLASHSEAVYLATDPDREGEAIAWHLSEILGVPEEKTWRVSFDEITSSAVQNAFKQPHKISINLVNAQQARRFLDRIMGYKLSPLLWEKITKGLSAGRVQSVALRLIVEREKKIRSFKPQEYWKITAELPLSPAPMGKAIPEGQQNPKLLLTKLNDLKVGSPLDINSQIWIGTEPEAKKLVGRLLKSDFIISSIIEKEIYQNPAPPFITSTLQQMASSRLNFSLKKTMLIAQQLYEGVDLPEGPTALITYMRTDSVKVSDQAIKECRNFIASNYGENLLQPKERYYKPSKQSQQAHEAIRPTYLSKTPESIRQYLNNDQYKLYNLIWRRFVATQMKPALWRNKAVEIDATLSPRLDLSVFSNDKKKNIIAEKILHGLQVSQQPPTCNKERQSPAFTKASTGNLVDLPELASGQADKIINIFNKNKDDEVTAKNILKELDKNPEDKALLVKVLGILDDTIENNLLDESLSVQKCVFGTNEHRLVFNGFLTLYEPEEQLLPALKEQEKLTTTNINSTQLFSEPPSRYNEASLVKILEKYGIGRPSTYAPIISTIQDRGYVTKNGRLLLPTELGILVNDKLIPFFDDIINTQFTARIEEELDLIEESKKDLLPTLRKFYEPFINDLQKAGNEMSSEKGKQTGEKCPKCSNPIVERWSRFGKFLSCSTYPECKYTRSLNIKSAPLESGEVCEKCGKPMVIRTSHRWRRRFLACSGYPECKNAKPFKEIIAKSSSENQEEKTNPDKEEIEEETNN
ncbi:MAG: type I DNA topoisomerase [Planctomycetota bacterium]